LIEFEENQVIIPSNVYSLIEEDDQNDKIEKEIRLEQLKSSNKKEVLNYEELGKFILLNKYNFKISFQPSRRNKCK
jgi:hypothetical protein